MSLLSRRPGGRLANGVVLGVACLGFFHLWSARLDATLAQEHVHLQALAADVDGMAHAAAAHIGILRTEAERELGREASSLLPLQLFALEAQGEGFTTRKLPDDLEPRQVSYLFGRGELPTSAGETATEMAASLALNPLMADVRQNVPEAAWVYYTSLNRFTNLVPYQGPAMADRLVWSDAFLAHALFQDTAPERNPGRRVRWHEAYLDQAGAGLLTSVVAPVYDGSGRFRAIVGLDFTLASLAVYLKGSESGSLLIVNRAGQVLAATGGAEKGRVRQLSEAVPAELGETARAFLDQPAGSYRDYGSWQVLAEDLHEAPWRVLLVQDGRALGWRVLAEMRVEIAGMILLVLLLVAVDRRQRLAEVLREGDTRSRRIIEGSDQGFWDWNLKTRELKASPRFESMLGYGPGESPLAHKEWPQHIHPEDLPRMRASVDRHMEGLTPSHRLEFRARTKAGQWKWLLTQGRIVERDPEGRPLVMSGTLSDISERKRAEAELIAAKQAAEAANVAKSRFLAAASHDLRQPLQASNLFISALERTGLNDEQKKITHNLALATKALGELLDALLDISKLDAGVVTPQLSQLEIYEVFQRIESEFASLALEKDLRFKLYFPTRPLIFETDPGLLMGLLRNLIGNAIRYTEWGGVLVGARLRKDRLAIQVWDTGIGIKEDDLPRIYEEFYQVDNPQRDRVRGLGLGLSIVKRMADLLGYQLSCHSRYGRGTVFELGIPLREFQRVEMARPQKPPASPDDLASLAGSRCVLVEDDPLVASALAAWLDGYGVSLRHFPDGDAALADPAIADADFYITDFRMPGELDGIGLLNAIQRRASRPLRALIVTGDTSVEQIDAFAAAGWRVLHKPIEPQRLIELLARMGRENGR